MNIDLEKAKDLAAQINALSMELDELVDESDVRDSVKDTYFKHSPTDHSWDALNRLENAIYHGLGQDERTEALQHILKTKADSDHVNVANDPDHG